MTSILTNVGAIAALQTLRALDSSMQKNQGQVNSGLRVANASDNAAYWSISTTMRSDNMAILAVKDALGLGAAKVDVAYAGTSAIVDILKEYKARLVAATEQGVDKAKIQTELNQLNDQAESIVRASSFNGVNWLQTGLSVNLDDVPSFLTSVTSSFVRSAGTVAVGRTNVDLREISMLNAGGGGILQKDGAKSVPDFGKVVYDTYHHEGHEDHTFFGPVTFGAADTFTFTLVIDRSPVSLGETYPIVIDKALVDSALGTSDGIVKDAFDVRAVLQKVFDDAGAKASAYRPGTTTSSTWYDVMSLDGYGHVASSLYFENLNSTLTGTQRFLGLDSRSSNNHDNMETTATLEFGGPFSIKAGSELSFDISIDGGATTTVIIDRATVNAALGNGSGRIASAAEYATVFQHAAGGLGLVVNVVDSKLTFSADQTLYPGYGDDAVDFYISDIDGDVDNGFGFDLAEIDITGSAFTLDEYISGVERMLEKAIASASNLGSLQARIDLQTEFAAKLSDSIDSGIGRLVDADMNEASTRLKAIQTQQQLAIQSLSIANSAPETMLQLFR